MGDKIRGTARLGGKTFVEGDEDAMQELADKMGVSPDRAYGVDSTEDRASRKPRGPEQRVAALARKAEKDAEKGKVDSEELLSTPVDGLADALASVTDVGALKRLLRREKRATAKPLIQARIDELKADEDAGNGEE